MGNYDGICEDLNLIVERTRNSGANLTVDDIWDHQENCETCESEIDIPDEPNDILNGYLVHFADDPAFEDFTKRFRGIFDTEEDYIWEVIDDVYSEELDVLNDLCERMGLHLPDSSDIDKLMWTDSYVSHPHGTLVAIFADE